MWATRRTWAVAGAAGLLAALAAVFARPILFVGAAGLGGWALANQYAFVDAVDRTAETLTIDQTVEPPRIVTEESTRIALTASHAVSTPLNLTITPAYPVSADRTDESWPTLQLGADEQDARAMTTVSWPVAGSFEIDPPTVEATDGWFGTRFEYGDGAEVVVEPRTPRDVHLGEGGEPLVAQLGEHQTGRFGTGFEPAELREYTPGDRLQRIDWKVTARLNHPYVREFEAETDRTTALLIDHRASMGEGVPGETKLDYARSIVLALLDVAHSFNDPVACYAVGNEGITDRYAPSNISDHYAVLREYVRDLTATEAAGTPSARLQVTNGSERRSLDDATPRAEDGTEPQRGVRPELLRAATTRPKAARRMATALAGVDTSFGATLEPFFATLDPYVEQIERDPLVATARAHLPRLSGALWTVIVTDDSNPAEVHETVSIARRNEDHVLVLLTPTVLYERGGLTDLEEAYERYAAFESFRRDLAGRKRVSALEIAPGERLEAVLAAGRQHVQTMQQNP